MNKLLPFLAVTTLGLGLALPAESASAQRFDETLGENVFTVTYDFNGGATYEGKTTLEKESVGVAPALNGHNLIDCVVWANATDTCHAIDVAEGKTLSYVTVNGERHNLEEGDGYMLAQDTEIVYYWEDANRYTIDFDETGESISFQGEEDHTYAAIMNTYSFNMTEEELAELEIDAEEYEAGKAVVSAATEEYGDLLAYIEITVLDASNNNAEVHDGPFDVKLELTDDIKGYDEYALSYVDPDAAEIVAEEPVPLTIDGDYLTGTVHHLSGYALLGSMTEEEPAESETPLPKAPDTGRFTAVSATTSSIVLPALTIALALALTAFIISHKSRA